jgi:hypothetical protein
MRQPPTARSIGVSSPGSDAEDAPEVRLRDVINMIIGVIITIAPWFNGDDAYSHGAIRLRAVAACVCIVSLWIIMHQRDVRAQFVNAALGVALVTAPLWRGGIDPYRIDMAAAGLVVAAFSLSRAIQILRGQRAVDAARAKTIAHKPSLN